MTAHTFAKCLKTALRYGTKPEERRDYYLPYEGNLTDSKFDQLATRLVNEVAPLYRNMTAGSIHDALKKRLKNEWYTGRERNVSFEQDSFGTWTIKGENWFSFGTRTNDFQIIG